MNLLIENCETQEYLTPSGSWSKNPLEGEVFPSTTVALRAVGQKTIAKFNLVFVDTHANPFLRLNFYASPRTEDAGNRPPA